MIPDLALIAGASAGCASALSLIVQWRQGRKLVRQSASAREALERQERSCSEQIAALRESQEAFQTSFQSTRDVLRDGRLNRSTRAASLQLLRAGMSPDTAAASLSIAKREMRMLAKVSALLSAV